VFEVKGRIKYSGERGEGGKEGRKKGGGEGKLGKRKGRSRKKENIDM